MLFKHFCLKKLYFVWASMDGGAVMDDGAVMDGDGVLIDGVGSPTGDGSSGGIDDAAAAATIIWCWR
uniref:Uncharacterized protein n=1 Tax=Panagrolaimus sp. PS1159 TaxID=55785 RepID=A0AC35GI76_9BILA